MIVSVTITLEIECEIETDPNFVVDSLLDAGFLQDAINDHDCDAAPMHVLAAKTGEE